MLSMCLVFPLEFYTINYMNCNYNGWAYLQAIDF